MILPMKKMLNWVLASAATELYRCLSNRWINEKRKPCEPAEAGNRRAAASCYSYTHFIADKKGFQPGTCLDLKEDTGIGNIPAFNDSIFRDARESLANGKTVFKNYLSEKDNYTAFIEYRSAPISLVITGAGNDVIPLVQMAELLGWQTTVIDGRPLYAKKERFTSSCTVMVFKT